MPRFFARVTNGQRAAVCGLMIAGVKFTPACEVVGVSRPRLKEVLPTNWEKPVRKRNRVWDGKRLERIRRDYADRSVRLREIAEKYGIHPAYLSTLARRQGWPLRGRGHWGPRKRILLTREQRLVFDKLRRHGVDLQQARAVALA